MCQQDRKAKITIYCPKRLYGKNDAQHWYKTLKYFDTIVWK